MPRRRTATGATVDPKIFRWCDGVGRDPFFRLAGYPNRAMAEQGWRDVRRQVWADTHRFRLPRAAECYDGLQREAQDILWSSWSFRPGAFALDAVLVALDEDRAAVVRFEQCDADAGDIAAYLALFRQDFDTIEAEARHVAALHAAGRIPERQPQITSAQRYGGAG